MDGVKKKDGDSPKKDAKKENSPSLFKAMLRCFGPRYALLGIFTFFEECILRIYQPLFMGEKSSFMIIIQHSKINEVYVFDFGKGRLISKFV